MSARRILSLLAAAALLALPACDPVIHSAAAASLTEGRQLTAAERSRMRAVLRGEVLREDQPFYGSAVEVARGSVSGVPLPARVEGARGLALALPGQSDIQTIAGAITGSTGIPVNIRTRYVLGDGSVIDVPIGTRMNAAHEGALSSFLDRLAARMDVGWSYDGEVITIDRMVRQTWRLALPVGQTTITDTPAAGASGVTVSTTRNLDPWADLEARLAPLAPPPARITLSPEAGRVEVFGPPSVQALVGQVLDDVAATAATRIGLEVAVYFVDSDRADEFGIGVNIADTVGNVGATLTAAAAGEATGGLVLSRGASSLDFQALARDRSVVDYRLASTVGQSGVISPISLTEERSYVRSVTSRTNDDTNETSESFDIADLETGLSLAALPRLVGPRRIQLAFTLTQRAFRGFDEEVEARSGIQTPTVDNRSIRNQTVLAPGETLVLSGYEQTVAAIGDSGFGVFRRIGLGGARTAQQQKVRMVVLVRPTLIPSGGRG